MMADCNPLLNVSNYYCCINDTYINIIHFIIRYFVSQNYYLKPTLRNGYKL